MTYVAQKRLCLSSLLSIQSGVRLTEVINNIEISQIIVIRGEKQQTSMIKTTVLQFMFNATFLLVNTIKMIGILLNLVHFQVHKNIIITKESDGFHNHYTQLTMAKYTLF